MLTDEVKYFFTFTSTPYKGDRNFQARSSAAKFTTRGNYSKKDLFASEQGYLLT
jgi:hypothetical protein